MGSVLGQTLIVLSTTGIQLYKDYLPFIMYYGNALWFTCELHYLPIFEHMSIHWAIKVYMLVKFHIHTRVFEILREMLLIYCGCMLLFTNM